MRGTFDMSSIVKPYLFRAAIIGVFAVILGVALSIIVYVSTEKVRENAIELVEQRIPILTSINQIISDLSEQERIVQEYYATQDRIVFLASYSENLQAMKMHTDLLFSSKMLVQEENEILSTQENIESLIEAFHQAMSLQEDNWDEMRDILFEISSARKQLLPTLLRIEKETQIIVDKSHENTLQKMETTHWMVLSYGFGIVFFAAVGAWYIRKYILTNAQNTRLAQFSLHNPNPILSVNNLGEVVYNNPACESLLEKVRLNKADVQHLIPENFSLLRTLVSKSETSQLTIEQNFHDRILQTNINWLKSIDAYDIHIVDETERKLAEQEVNHLAFFVQETNLPNQHKLENDLCEMIEFDKAFSLGVFGITEFAQLVAGVGIQTADNIVQQLAKDVSLKLPAGVKLYQLNERLFSIVMFGEHSSKMLENIASSILEIAEDPIITDYGDFFIELDLGFSAFPQHGETSDKLLQNAMTALSVASHDEHSHFTVFNQAFASGIQSSINMLDNLRNAVQNDELFLVFQPQLDLHQQRITGIETLVRWKHDDKVISPTEFIPLAEESGLIVSIGKWILENACEFAKKLVEKGHVDVVVAVNVSPRQFSHPEFLATVKSILEKTDLAPRNLELEITEGVFMHNEEQMLALLHQIKDIGLQLSIDDFGTGYSSLSYLKKFPVDKLKIDQSFIKDCHNNEEDKAIVKTIVGLGKSLGLSLIAEGVEEETHVDFLTEIDCEEIQGYWYSRPVEPDALMAFIEQKNATKVEDRENKITG